SFASGAPPTPTPSKMIMMAVAINALLRPN
ncbi:MAG: hypothetical protein ACI8S7_000661, partial [Candidatus Krumholzibacteriia bacterium]